MSRNRRQRPTPPTPTPLITTTEARDLAADLIRELAQHAGDAEQVRAVLLRWLETQDTYRLSLIGLAALEVTFSHCITVVDEVPPGALALDPPKGITDDRHRP